ncbi:hypothetical protein HDE_06612 [Halotydeus destructor]|nr:hypothetical protein HDE_06612 [Halotydeus destructor]
MASADTSSLDHAKCDCPDQECQLSYEAEASCDIGQTNGRKQSIPSKQITVSDTQKWNSTHQRLWNRMALIATGRYDRIKKLNRKARKLNKNRKRRQCLRHVLPFEQLIRSPRTSGVLPPQPGLRCYTCNVDGYPSCDDPFSLDNNKLATCNENRPDNGTELCAKIKGTVLEGTYGSFGPNSSYFGRGCFPLGDGWVWRTEPYNETFIFGNLTIEGGIYMCRNTKCNGSPTGRQVSLLGLFAAVSLAAIL